MRLSALASSVAATALLVAGCGSPSSGKDSAAKAKPAEEDTAIPVEVVQPNRAEMLATYSGTATLEAEADADVIARVAGEVRRILVEEGDRVRAGQLLAALDDRQLRLEVAQARAALAKLERDYNRQIELHQKGLVAAGTFEGLKFDLDNLRATHDLTQLQLSYTQIRAPFAGIVAARNVKLGQTLEPGTAVFRVTDPMPLKAEVFVPERELARLRPGQPAAIQVDALADRTFAARVSLVSPTVDAKTATFKVTVEVEDPRGELKPGMFGRIGIVFERRPEALQIPRVALVETDGEAAVFIVQDGLARRRAIRTGLANAGSIEITEGLAGTERVVVVGQSALKDGNKVKVVSLDAPPEKATARR
ncbi:MAG: efflux RND transporter periplasmic adaptor subunit [Gammaproteobacteria bacterium]